jgi:hypothetical protein
LKDNAENLQVLYSLHLQLPLPLQGADQEVKAEPGMRMEIAPHIEVTILCRQGTSVSEKGCEDGLLIEGQEELQSPRKWNQNPDWGGIIRSLGSDIGNQLVVRIFSGNVSVHTLEVSLLCSMSHVI